MSKIILSGIVLATIFVAGIFLMGFIEDAEAARTSKPKEIVVVGSKVVTTNEDTEIKIPIKGAICTIEVIGANESLQIGNDRTNNNGKVTLIAHYDGLDVEALLIVCEKDDFFPETLRVPIPTPKTTTLQPEDYIEVLLRPSP